MPLRYFYHWGTPAVHVSPVQFGCAWMMEFVRRTWGSGAAGGAVGVVVRENCVNFTWQMWRLPRWCYTSVKLGCFSSHLVLA